MNEAAAIIHDVAHPDANIIFGNVIDDWIGDTVRVTVVAGFDRFDAAEETPEALGATFTFGRDVILRRERLALGRRRGRNRPNRLGPPPRGTHRA